MVACPCDVSLVDAITIYITPTFLNHCVSEALGTITALLGASTSSKYSSPRSIMPCNAETNQMTRDEVRRTEYICTGRNGGEGLCASLFHLDWLMIGYIFLMSEDIHKFHLIIRISTYLYLLDGWLLTTALILFPRGVFQAAGKMSQGAVFPDWYAGKPERLENL